MKTPWTLVVATAVLAVGCRDATGPCSARSKPAFFISAFNGSLFDSVRNATVVYDRHGDDSLTILHVANLGRPLGLGHGPGIYDFRISAPHFQDFVETNFVVTVAACAGSPPASEIFLDPAP